MSTFIVKDGSYEAVITAATAAQAARKYFAGDMDENKTTFHVAHVGRWDRRRCRSTVIFSKVYLVAVPKPPRCTRKRGHLWISGEAYASGGGSAHTDTCSCGARRRVDNWGQNRKDGTYHRTVEYF
jgi:hypothetical protein